MNPIDYLADTLRAILDGHPKSRIEDLMPRRHDQPSSLAAYGQAVALTMIEALATAVAAVHPYEVPAIVALPIRTTTPSYASWIRTETGG